MRKLPQRAFHHQPPRGTARSLFTPRRIARTLSVPINPIPLGEHPSHHPRRHLLTLGSIPIESYAPPASRLFHPFLPIKAPRKRRGRPSPLCKHSPGVYLGSQGKQAWFHHCRRRTQHIIITLVGAQARLSARNTKFKSAVLWLDQSGLERDAFVPVLNWRGSSFC